MSILKYRTQLQMNFSFLLWNSYKNKFKLTINSSSHLQYMMQRHWHEIMSTIICKCLLMSLIESRHHYTQALRLVCDCTWNLGFEYLKITTWWCNQLSALINLRVYMRIFLSNGFWIRKSWVQSHKYSWLPLEDVY